MNVLKIHSFNLVLFTSFLQPFKIIPLNEADSNVNVIITDDSYIEAGYIGCLLEKYYDNLKAITLFLKEHDISDQPYKPK